MADQQYDDNRRFVLFPEANKQHERGPDFTGKLTFNVDTLKELANLAQEKGGEIDLRLAGWKRDGKNGMFLSGEASVPQERAAASSEPPF